MIETVNLTKYFYSKKTIIKAVDNVSLEIKKGEVFCLLGPNGAGKTTLLKMLATLILPTSGTAYVNGYDITKDEIGVKSSIGFVGGDERSFYWRLTGRQNLEFYASLYNLFSSQSKERINQLLNLLEVELYADRMFVTYSTGIKQKFSIIRALLHNPAILLVDEPTKSLDPRAASHLRKFIKEKLSREQKETILFVTHQIEEAKELSDRIGIMQKGRFQVCEKKEDLEEILEINHEEEGN